MREFQPDYTNMVKAARNIEVKRFPLYEHKVDPKVMEGITGVSFAELYNGDDRDLDEFFRNYCGFYRDMGYDTVSFEELIGLGVECWMQTTTRDSKEPVSELLKNY